MAVRFFFAFILFSCLYQSMAFCQVGQAGLRMIENALQSGEVAKADSALKTQLNFAKHNGLNDSIPLYTSYVGRVAGEISGNTKGIESVNRFVGEFLEEGHPANLNKQIYLGAASYFEYIGRTSLAYQANLRAFHWASIDSLTSFKDRGRIQNNLATYSLYLGKRTQAKEHVFKAIELYRREPKLDPESMYLSYNALGNINWYGSRFDSAEYYFQEALRQFPEMEATPRNQHYRPALVLNNLAGVQSVLGKSSAGIQSMETTIRHLNDYIKEVENPLEKAKSQEFLYQAIDNLAGMHKGLGNYTKARDLLEYACEQKKRTFGPESAEVFKSQILLGQIYYALHEFGQAKLLLEQGIAMIQSFGEDYTDWKADAFSALARLEESMGDSEKASQWYSAAEHEYQKILGGDYDFIYLDFLMNASTFFASFGKRKEALRMAKTGLRYVQANRGKGSLLDFNQQINLAEVYFILNDFRQSFELSEKAIRQFEKGLLTSEQSWLDSIQIETQKPKAILLNVKSSYFLKKEKSPEFIKKSIARLEEAIELVERRKTNIHSEQDIRLLISDNQELYNFVKQLDLKLFELTGDKKCIESILIHHESAVFNRLRSRLQQFDNIRFADIPVELQTQELQLKTNLTQSLQIGTEGLGTYLQAHLAWEDFLQSLKEKYPTYYQFRYGNYQTTIDEIQKSIPKGSTLIRYLLVGNNLIAVVMNTHQQQLVKLDYSMVEKHIDELSFHWNEPAKTLSLLHTLYQKLWQPLEKYIATQNITIIQDGPLFNLSFELLTPNLLSGYEEFASGSLLAKYSIGYHFHSQLLKPRTNQRLFRSNYVAFAPVFSDKMKTDYLLSVDDSLYLDRTYLNLVPQPFTRELVGKMWQTLGGKAFVENQSTLGNFIKYATNNRILHIGTHAESNNISPDFSKLIFSKTNKPIGLERGNELYALDIYNLNLQSQIAVLTACETGKSTIAPGEGMLSLAHAFTYAGSESLLVGIWKIDEKASSQITEVFFQKLAEGMDKATSLKEAKLAYLSGARGRSLSPEFWAGLALIGDSNPIELETTASRWKFAFAAIGILILGGLIWRKIRALRMKNSII